jgi:hypothetical protein
MLITRFSLRCAALVFGAIAAVPYAAAQCSDLSGPNYKVLIDEVEFAAASGDQPVLSLELLRASVEGALRKVRQGVLKGSVPHGDIDYRTCKGQHPSKSQFTGNFVRSMAANHAILEFWGTLFPPLGGQHQFEIDYVMFPVGSLDQPRPSEFASTQKKMPSKPTSAEIIDYMIDARADLPAFFTVATGVQAYADHDWDQAVRLLCEARSRLKKNADQADLMNFADQVATEAAANLRKNNLTAANLLTDAQARNYCRFATTR